MSGYAETNLYDRVIDRWKQLEPAYTKFNTARDSIKEYFRLDIDTITEESGRGKFFGRTVYEGTAPWAAKTMARFFQGSLVAQNIDWLKYVMREFELKGIDELDVFCQDVREYMSDVYRRSNFYKVLPNYTLEGLTTGSPLIFMEENDPVEGIIKCMPNHYKHFQMYYDKYGEQEGVIIRDPTWTAKQIDDRFGGSDRENKFSVSILNDLKQGQFRKEHTIYRAVFKATDPMWDRQGFTKPRYAKWISVYFEENKKTGTEDTPLATEPFFSKPFAAWNYNRIDYEVVSRTPAFEAIYDTLSQQQVHKTFLENAKLKTNPPLISLMTMKNRLEFWPDGVTFVEPDEYQYAPKNLEVVGDVLYNKEVSDILRESVKRWFMLDMLMKFSEIAKDRKQPLPVYQLWKIAGENSTLLSPAIETYNQDLLGPVDERFLDIEMRAGRGPFEPNRIDEIRGIILSVINRPMRGFGIQPEFIGPLIRAQKLQQALEPIREGMAVAQEISVALGDPDLPRLAIRGYEVLDQALEAIGFPQKNVRPQKEYEEAQNILNQQRAQQMQFENAVEAAKAAKGVSGKVDDTSVINQLTGAA
jgi:hypothetical protein